MRAGFANLRMAGLLAGQHNQAVVGGSIAIHGDAVKGFIDGVMNDGIQRGLTHHCIGSDVAQHGRHIGVYHARAFTHAGDGHGLTVYQQAARRGLGHDVGGHDGFSRR